MTTNELKETCRKKGISFIPHHECGLCGQPTGWYLFERWPPYEVAYSSACGCGDSGASRSTWTKEKFLEALKDYNPNVLPINHRPYQNTVAHMKHEQEAKPKATVVDMPKR